MILTNKMFPRIS